VLQSWQDPMSTASVAEIYNFRAVDERLATSGQPSEAQIQAIAAAGFEVIINLALHDVPRYSLPDEAATVRACGLHYVHIPVQFAAPTASDLLQFFAAMDASAQRKVWVHCAANMRVTAFLGLYRCIRQRQPPAQAFALMKGLWEPDAIWSEFIAAMLQQHAPAA
jgi:uncharacterized protein (TIGR01244 family)